MLIRFFLFLTMNLIGLVGHTAEICSTMQDCQSMRTQLSASLAQVEAKIVALEPFIFRDYRNNLSWSRILPGLYSNGCTDANGDLDYTKCTTQMVGGDRQVVVNDSGAALECQKIGARLPTRLEVNGADGLIRNFDHRLEHHGYVLTENGRKQLRAIFGDLHFGFWTSSILNDRSSNGYTFDEGAIAPGAGVSAEYRTRRKSVLCVR